MYRLSKKETDALIFNLAANLLLEFVCSHVYSQHEVVNDCKSAVPFKFLQLNYFNSHMEIDLCFSQMVFIYENYRVCPKKRLPFEIKRYCRMSELIFQCFISPMAQECIERYSREFLCMHTWSRISK